jgi:hypothetical protein
MIVGLAFGNLRSKIDFFRDDYNGEEVILCNIDPPLKDV